MPTYRFECRGHAAGSLWSTSAFGTVDDLQDAAARARDALRTSALEYRCVEAYYEGSVHCVRVHSMQEIINLAEVSEQQAIFPGPVKYIIEFEAHSGWRRSISRSRGLDGEFDSQEQAQAAIDAIEPGHAHRYRVVPLTFNNQVTPAPKQESPQEMSPTIPAPTPARGSLCDINVTRDKQTRALQLVINAKPLHDTLDALGVASNSSRYDDQPACDYNIVRGTTLSSKLFLEKKYPYVVNLTGVFSQPPTVAKLREVAESGQEVIKKILDHYQPVDISITINKRTILT